MLGGKRERTGGRAAMKWPPHAAHVRGSLSNGWLNGRLASLVIIGLRRRLLKALPENHLAVDPSIHLVVHILDASAGHIPAHRVKRLARVHTDPADRLGAKIRGGSGEQRKYNQSRIDVFCRHHENPRNTSPVTNAAESIGGSPTTYHGRPARAFGVVVEESRYSKFPSNRHGRDAHDTLSGSLQSIPRRL